MTIKSKIGIHVNANARDNYGDLAPHINSLVTFDINVLREANPDATMIYRSQAEANHKDGPGDFDQLDFDLLKPAARYWFNEMQHHFEKVRSEFPNVYIQFTNEINSPAPDVSKGEAQPRILEYTQGLIDVAAEQGFKLAILGDAGGSPDWDLWKQYWLPFLVKNSGKDIIYNRHIYTRIAADWPLYLTKNTVSRQTTHDSYFRPMSEAIELYNADCDVPILISELGWSGGWKELPKNWLPDIIRYNDMLLQHDNIIGACLWCMGQWSDLRMMNGTAALELSQELSQNYTPWIRDQVTPVEPSNPGPVVPEPIEPSETSLGDYLFLERFNTLDWYDWTLPNGNRSNMQVPVGFRVENKHGQNDFADGQPWNDFGYSEAVFMTTGHNLPEGNRDEYTLYPSVPYPDENVAYHLFANSPYHSYFHREVDVQEGRTYRVTLKVFPDFAFYGDDGKTTEGIDPQHAQVAIKINNDPLPRKLPLLRQHNEIVHEFQPGQDGPVEIGFEFLSVYAMSPNQGVAGYFIQEMSVQDITTDDIVITDPVDEQQDNFLEYITDRVVSYQTQSLNSDAALQKEILDYGMLPISNESWYIPSDTVGYAVQGAEILEEGVQVLFYVVIGEWDNVDFLFITPELESSTGLIGNLIRHMREHQTQSLNRDAALQKGILANGWLPISNEEWVTHAGTNRHLAIQGAQDLATGAQYVVYADVGEWDEVFVHQFSEGDIVDPPVVTTPTGSRPDVFNGEGFTEFIDVSHWQGEFSYDVLPEHVIGVVAKATEGVSYRDPLFRRNHDESKSKGLIFGAYHFFRPGESPVAQADNFAREFVKYDHVHFWVVDVEKELSQDNDSFYDEQLKLFIETASAMVDMKPFIYTSKSKFTALTTNPEWAVDYPLWVSHFRNNAGYPYLQPHVPYPWAPGSWTLYQYTERNTSYINRRVDANMSILPRYEFMALCQSLTTDTGVLLHLSDPEGESTPGDPPVDSGGILVDLRPYVIPQGDDTGNYIVQTVSGPHAGASEVFFVEKFGNELQVNKNHLFERYIIDSDYLLSDMDTSPGPDSAGNQRFYVVRREYGSNARVPRFPLDMMVGEHWEGRDHWVQFFRKDNGQPLSENSGVARNSATLVSVGRWVHPVTAKVFDDVAVIQMGGETQVYAEGRLLAWVSQWGSSQYAADQGNIATQPPKVPQQVAAPQW